MSAFCLINQLKIDFLFSKVRMARTFKDITLNLRLKVAVTTYKQVKKSSPI